MQNWVTNLDGSATSGSIFFPRTTRDNAQLCQRRTNRASMETKGVYPPGGGFVDIIKVFKSRCYPKRSQSDAADVMGISSGTRQQQRWTAGRGTGKIAELLTSKIFSAEELYSRVAVVDELREGKPLPHNIKKNVLKLINWRILPEIPVTLTPVETSSSSQVT